ncbi:hypothetical protein C8Q72DRAFT_954800 [Fomitopsis betulina]|nr:hypothetical protein C8Q72DRAFT_954800 [Fomitopsis betulina]
MLQLDPYKGNSRKLVLAIDIGTTYSGVAYCVLDPGEIPKVLSVTRFPGQEGENRSRDVKIPSVLYYDRKANLQAAGAEAMLPNVQDDAYENEWTLVKWFKLYLRPQSILPGATLPPIGVDKPVVEILSDYLGYVFKCAKAFISETNPIGRQILSSSTPIDFVLSHPNGWLGPQQNSMRRTANLADLIPDSDEGASRLQFVTEGEASLQFCVATGLGEDVIQEDNFVTMVDCGGGTIDLSMYHIVGDLPITVEESTIPDCLIQGSTMVNYRAEDLLKAKLRGSCFATPEDIDAMMSSFESMAKPTFRDPSVASYIKFGRSCDNDQRLNIRRGTLTLSGLEMVSLLRPSVDAIKAAIDKQLSLGVDPTLVTVLVVVGFATSPFLRSELSKHCDAQSLRMFCPEGQISKAVAEGALWFYLDHRVRARTIRHTYGVPAACEYISSDPEHCKRKHLAYTQLDGSVALSSSWIILARKGTTVTETIEFKQDYVTRQTSRQSIKAYILSYEGTKSEPEWIDEQPEMFSPLCMIKAKPAATSWKQCEGPLGPYWQLSYSVIFLLGLTEVKAQITWWEDGVQQRTPAQVVYDDI